VEGEEDSQDEQSESVTDTDTQTETENEASVPKVGTFYIASVTCLQKQADEHSFYLDRLNWTGFFQDRISDRDVNQD
jgi:hypothetical protein